MKLLRKILYYTRIVLFILTLFLLFFTLNNYIKVGWSGYLFLGIVFIYIVVSLMTLLSKKKVFKNDFMYNFMQIATYIYQVILTIKMFSFNVSLLVKESIIFYRNNYLILSILLISLIIYTCILNFEEKVNIELKKKSQ